MASKLTKKQPHILYGEGDRLSVLKELLNKLGQPDQAFKIIHLAGTNGKGSTATMISRLLLNHGLRTGLFTSPHLISECESIQVNEEQIDIPSFRACQEQVEKAALLLGLSPQEDLSQFETTYLVAMVYFANLACDYVVLECGLGGALDATNAIQAADYAIFTKIGMDHIDILGNSLSEIVATKSGIMRPGQGVIIAPNQKPEVLDQLQMRVKQVGGRLIPLKEQVQGTDRPNYFMTHWQGQEIEIYLPLLGAFQKENLTTALTWYQDWLQVEAINNEGQKPLVEVFDKLVIPGRLEQVSKQPPVYLDAAHNLDGMTSLVESIKALYPEGRVRILCGFLKDKDVPSLVEILAGLTADFYITEADFPGRTLAVRDLDAIFKARRIETILCPNPVDGLKALMEAEVASPIFVIGSFHLIKRIRGLFNV